MITNNVFSYLNKLNSDKVGSKAARLSDLHSFNIKIPVFLCLSVNAFELFLDHNNIKIKNRSKSETDVIQKMILKGDIPKQIKEEFEQKWFKCFPNGNLTNCQVSASKAGIDMLSSVEVQPVSSNVLNFKSPLSISIVERIQNLTE